MQLGKIFKSGAVSPVSVQSTCSSICVRGIMTVGAELSTTATADAQIVADFGRRDMRYDAGADLGYL